MDQKNLLNFNINAQLSELEIYLSCKNEQIKKESKDALTYYSVKKKELGKEDVEGLKNINAFLFKKLDYIRNIK